MIPGAARTMPWTTGMACLMPLATEKTLPAVVTAPIALFRMGLEFDSTALLVNAEPAIFFLSLKLNGYYKNLIFGFIIRGGIAERLPVQRHRGAAGR